MIIVTPSSSPTIAVVILLKVPLFALQSCKAAIVPAGAVATPIEPKSKPIHQLWVKRKTPKVIIKKVAKDWIIVITMLDFPSLFKKSIVKSYQEFKIADALRIYITG